MAGNATQTSRHRRQERAHRIRDQYRRYHLLRPLCRRCLLRRQRAADARLPLRLLFGLWPVWRRRAARTATSRPSKTDVGFTRQSHDGSTTSRAEQRSSFRCKHTQRLATNCNVLTAFLAQQSMAIAGVKPASASDESAATVCVHKQALHEMFEMQNPCANPLH